MSGPLAARLFALARRRAARGLRRCSAGSERVHDLHACELLTRSRSVLAYWNGGVAEYMELGSPAVVQGQLRLALESDAQCGLVRSAGLLMHAACTLELDTLPTASGRLAGMDRPELQGILDGAAGDAAASERVKAYHAAATSWANGGGAVSVARHLEAWLLVCPRDVLALRLATDAYAAVGEWRAAYDAAMRASYFLEGSDLHAEAQSIGALCRSELEINKDTELSAQQLLDARWPKDTRAMLALCRLFEAEGRAAEGESLLRNDAEAWSAPLLSVPPGTTAARLAAAQCGFQIDLGRDRAALSVLRTELAARLGHVPEEAEGERLIGAPAPPDADPLSDGGLLLAATAAAAKAHFCGARPVPPGLWGTLADAWGDKLADGEEYQHRGAQDVLAAAALAALAAEGSEAAAARLRALLAAMESFALAAGGGWDEDEAPLPRYPLGALRIAPLDAVAASGGFRTVPGILGSEDGPMGGLPSVQPEEGPAEAGEPGGGSAAAAAPAEGDGLFARR